MKIAINTENYDLINAFNRIIKDNGHETIIAKIENILFKIIKENTIDAFILEEKSGYARKAADFIKKENPYTPVIIFSEHMSKTLITSADIVSVYNNKVDINFFASTILHNIFTYSKNFEILQKLTAKMEDVIEFGECKYDPSRRLFYYNDQEIRKLSAKEGGVLELLAKNFGKVVKKEIIHQKVWHESNYFIGRSLDVYLTHLRNLFKSIDVKITIRNISNIGLILEYYENN